MGQVEAAAFDLDKLVQDLRAASRTSDATTTVRGIMDEAFAEPDAVASNVPEFTGDGEVLYEDDQVSIWLCRFESGVEVPPHDHQVSATIGVYAGSEQNSFYKAGPNGIERSSTVELSPGDVLSIGPSAIHTVLCTSDEPSCGIHVYLGPLTRIERSLFDPRSGARLPFTDEVYEELMGLQVD